MNACYCKQFKYIAKKLMSYDIRVNKLLEDRWLIHYNNMDIEIEAMFESAMEVKKMFSLAVLFDYPLLNPYSTVEHFVEYMQSRLPMLIMEAYDLMDRHHVHSMVYEQLQIPD